MQTFALQCCFTSTASFDSSEVSLYQKKDLDQAAVHFLDFTFPPGSLPLGFDDLANFKKHHGPAGIRRDVLLYEVSARRVLNVLPRTLHCQLNNNINFLKTNNTATATMVKKCTSLYKSLISMSLFIYFFY